MVNLIYRYFKVNPLLWQCEYIVVANRIYFLKKVHILFRQYKSIVVRK